MRLETERLILRKPKMDDLDGYAELWGDPEVVRYLSGTTLPRDQVPQAIERMLGHWERHGVGLFSVLRKEDERLIGRVGYLLGAMIGLRRQSLRLPLTYIWTLP